MTAKNYPAMVFDNLSRTSSILEEYMEALDEDPEADILAAFEAMALERKDTIDYRAATIRNVGVAVEQLANYKKAVDLKLKRLKGLETKLKTNTLDTMANFGQPFRGNFCELKANKTRGKVEIKLKTSTISTCNVVDVTDYQLTDIPEHCFGKVTHYYIKKDELYTMLANGLELNDAKIVEGKTLKIKDII